jgi:hypothetical protein
LRANTDAATTFKFVASVMVRLDPSAYIPGCDLYRYARCTNYLATTLQLQPQGCGSVHWLSLKRGNFNRRALVDASVWQIEHFEFLGSESKYLVDSSRFAPVNAAAGASGCKSFRQSGWQDCSGYLRWPSQRAEWSCHRWTQSFFLRCCVDGSFRRFRSTCEPSG